MKNFFAQPILFTTKEYILFFMKHLTDFVWDLCKLAFAIFCLNYLLKLFFNVGFF